MTTSMAVDGDALAGLLRARVGVRVTAGEPLGPLTTLKVGGPAAALVRAESPADLVAVAEVCGQTGRPWLIVGRGSNLLIADRGWPGVAVTLGRGFRGVTVSGAVVEAGAAEPMPILANAVARRRLGGLAFGVAIPGSLGGAVRMNAGAMGHELREVLLDAEVARLADGGRLERLGVAELGMAYRHTALPADAVVVRARLGLRHAEPAALAEEMAAFKRWRREHQPVNEPSCGSVFVNPPGDSAGRLIDSAGLKGHRVGGAAVSAKHANFITVSPGATAGDVAAVIADVRRVVAARHGVELKPEVVLAGFEEVT
jgi:UDP-N-acetylmuramate dehydrogenase